MLLKKWKKWQYTIYMKCVRKMPIILIYGARLYRQASALVFQFPLYWMSAPSLLKKWQDEVFTYLAKTPAVAGKALLVAVTTGSEYSAYRSGGRNNFTMDELLRPYQASAYMPEWYGRHLLSHTEWERQMTGKTLQEGVNDIQTENRVPNRKESRKR